MSVKISRKSYATKYGPTTGDRIRLADTVLWVEIEKDHTVYGEELVFGTGKSAREGMGMNPAADRTTLRALDLVITNALIIDYWGGVKADIGMRGGKIVGIGEAGNPWPQSGAGANVVPVA